MNFKLCMYWVMAICGIWIAVLFTALFLASLLTAVEFLLPLLGMGKLA